MASAQIELNVIYRNIPLYPHAILRDVDGSGGFLPSESPMPVGTLLTLSPVQNVTLQVPARVALVVEACRGGAQPAGELPGMSLVFEADGEQLVPYFHTDEPRPAPATEAAPAEVVVSIPAPQPDEVPADVRDKVIIDEDQLAATAPAPLPEEPVAAAPAVAEAEDPAVTDEGAGTKDEETEGDGARKKKARSRGGRRKKR